MNKVTIVLICSLFFCLCGKTQETILKVDKYPSGVVKREIVRIDAKNEKFVRLYYKTGEILGILPLKNDELHGVGKLFYKDGEIKSILRYKNGELKGKSEDYYNNGKVKVLYNYINGVERNYSREFYRTGDLYAEWITKNGKSGGEVYYQTGEVLLKVRHEDFRLIYIEGFNKDQNPLEGNISICYNSGIPHIESKFISGLPDGLYISYHENGQIAGKGFFNKGIPDGVHHEYNESGDLISEIPYKNGKIHGILKLLKNVIPGTSYEIRYCNGEKTSERVVEDELE